MALRFPNEGEAVALELLVNKTTTTRNLILRLFTNDLSYTEAIDATDLTEASFTGYSAKTLTGASWTTTGGDPTDLQYAQQEFELTDNISPVSVFGHYYTHETTGVLIAVNKYPQAIVMQNDGDRIRVTPILTAQDEVQATA